MMKAHSPKSFHPIDEVSRRKAFNVEGDMSRVDMNILATWARGYSSTGEIDFVSSRRSRLEGVGQVPIGVQEEVAPGIA